LKGFTKYPETAACSIESISNRELKVSEEAVKEAAQLGGISNRELKAPLRPSPGRRGRYISASQIEN